MIFLIVELSMLQRLEATSQFSACIAERRNCVCFLLSSQDDEVGHISVDFFLMIFVSIFIFLLRDVIWDVSVAYWQKFLPLMMWCFALCTQMVLWSSWASSFDSQYSTRTWVGRYQNGKPCWILMWQEWRRWQCNSKMCRAPVRSSPSEYHHHLIFSGRILPVTQPAVLKHWRQIVILV